MGFMEGRNLADLECDVLGDEIRGVHCKSCRVECSQGLTFWSFSFRSVSPLNDRLVGTGAFNCDEGLQRRDIYFFSVKLNFFKKNFKTRPVLTDFSVYCPV